MQALDKWANGDCCASHRAVKDVTIDSFARADAIGLLVRAVEDLFPAFCSQTLSSSQLTKLVNFARVTDLTMAA